MTILPSLPALLATLLATVPAARAQSPAAKAPANPPTAGTPKAADLPGFALIPAGEYTMGDALDGDENAPQHKVNVSAFYMQKKEVSKAEWDEVRAWGLKNGYPDLPEGKGKAADHPVHTVSWFDVVKWCNARSQKEGLIPCCYMDAEQTMLYQTGETDLANTMVKWSANGYRLPTEAEWEKAARGGLNGKRFPWGDVISHEQANFSNDGKESYQKGTTGFHPSYESGWPPYTSPVGSFAPNDYGLYDMTGNVWEWCWDRDGEYPSTLQTDPRGVFTQGSHRAFRGGSWNFSAHYTRCANRFRTRPSDANFIIGFRVARSSAIVAAPASHAQSKADATTRKDAATKAKENTAKATPVIARLEKALAAKDKFGAEDVLAELEALIPSDGRMAGLRERVAAVPGPKKQLTVDLGGGVLMEFILIRPGSFMMGSDELDESPAHKATLNKPFYLGKYEVTQEQWERVMGNNPSKYKGAKNPVEKVNHSDCQTFVAKLKEKLPGQPFRLPTEAEWEYACRAGSTGDYCYGEGKGQLGDYAWFGGNCNGTTHPVGKKKPNAWGLHDMHGNVWEWCADWYGGYPATAVTDPQGPAAGTDRVARGGGIVSGVFNCRTADRDYNIPSIIYCDVGFRLARSSVP